MLIPLLAIGGSESFRATLDFTTGVLALVALTASIAWGLIATDRLLLSPRHRLLAQAIHRATAAAALGFLLLHATVKVSLGHVDVIGALIPFGLGITGTAGLIGFGSLAGLLMVMAAATGVLRSALAGNIKVAGRWRALHMLAYPAWCFAVLHGLFAGRPAAPWVVVMYSLALVSVAGALSIRLLPRPVRRMICDKILALTGRGSGVPPTIETPLRERAPAPLRDTDESTQVGLEWMNGIPSQRPYGASATDRDAVGRRRRQARIAPPSPQLYEIPPRPAADPPVGAGYGVPGGQVGAGMGAGIAAAYHAVSLAGESSVPLAERVPMTEELPVVTESGQAPGEWRAPSPPPPAHAFPSTPTAPPRPTTPAPPYEPAGYGSSAPGTGFYPPPPGAAAPPFDAFSRPSTPAFPAPPPASPPPYEAPFVSSYEMFHAGSYESASYESATPGSYAAGPAGSYAPGYAASYDSTEAMPGPFFPPPAGEPWNAPAGERP
nr:hypothetical protein [Streptomyces sp. CWNU-1]